MKIEKVNDHQIRCTLTREDLAVRQLKISELAYGTDKAKQLFHDMMQQASFEFGFEAEDIPLMIEAIPLNSECIVLIITKVEDPEELDTRFAKFAPLSMTPLTKRLWKIWRNSLPPRKNLFPRRLQNSSTRSRKQKEMLLPPRPPKKAPVFPGNRLLQHRSGACFLSKAFSP